MRKLNLVLLVILLLLAVFTVYFRVGAKLRTHVEAVYEQGAEHPEAFDSIRSIMASGSAPQQFQPLPEDTSSLTMVDLTLTLTNVGLYDAEWLDISVAPAESDIAVYALTGEGSAVRARSVAQVNLKLLTRDPMAPRTLQLNYYVYGMPQTIEIRA